MKTTLSLRSAVPVIVFILSALSAESVLGQATLENPAPNSFQSGISVISGWACNARRIEIAFNDGPPQEAAYGTSRGDTQATCGDTDNGFGLLFNWNLLGDGIHTVQALADGVEFASLTVIVTTLGKEFLQGASGTFLLSDFPDAGVTRTLRWQQGQQNFVLTDGSPDRGGGTSGAAPHVLENPTPGSFQSGIGLISGWVCDAQTITIRFDDGPPQEAAYGTSRGDTQGACGDTDNGFGLPFNWNLLDDGLHTVTASADGVEFARVEVAVTTLGTEFRRGLSREVVISDFPHVGTDVVLQWQEAQQNFAITTALPTQRLMDVNPGVALPAGVSIPNVAVRSLYTDTAEVPASPKPSLLLAEDGDGTVLLGVANRDGGLLGERDGSVAVSVDSTAVVLVVLAAGHAIHTIDQSLVAAIQAHPSYQALIAAMSTQIAADKNFLDRLPDHTDIVVSIQEVATAIVPSPQRAATHSLSSRGLAEAPVWPAVGNVTVQEQGAGPDIRDEVAEQKRRLAVSLFAASVADLFLPTAPLQRVLQILMMQPTYDPAYSACVAARVRERTAEGGLRSLSPRELSELATGASLPLPQLAEGLAGALQDAEAALECTETTPPSSSASARPALRALAQRGIMGLSIDISPVLMDRAWKIFKGVIVPMVGGGIVKGAVGGPWGMALGVLTTVALSIKANAAADEAARAGVSLVPPSELLPAPPTNLRITEVSANFVALDWDAPEGGAENYNIYYRSPNEPETLIANASTTDAQITGAVVPGECYRVSAVSADGVESEKTDRECVDGPLEPPTNLRVESVTQDSITLAWDPVEYDNGVTYVVWENHSQVALSSATTYTVADLRAGEVYCFAVTATPAGAEEQSLPTPPVCGTTSPLTPAPRNLRIESTTSSSITLTWDPVESSAPAVYMVAQYSEGSTEPTQIITAPGTLLIINGLSQAVRYCFTVTAAHTDGSESHPSMRVCGSHWPNNYGGCFWLFNKPTPYAQGEGWGCVNSQSQAIIDRQTCASTDGETYRTTLHECLEAAEAQTSCDYWWRGETGNYGSNWWHCIGQGNFDHPE